jgi:hypothetical protein
VLRIARRADAAGRLVQHEIPRRSPCLQHFVIHLDAAEFTHLCLRIDDGLAVDPYATFH